MWLCLRLCVYVCVRAYVCVRVSMSVCVFLCLVCVCLCLRACGGIQHGRALAVEWCAGEDRKAGLITVATVLGFDYRYIPSRAYVPARVPVTFAHISAVGTDTAAQVG